MGLPFEEIAWISSPGADTTDLFLINLDVVFFHLCHDKMDKDSEEQGPQREL